MKIKGKDAKKTMDELFAKQSQAEDQKLQQAKEQAKTEGKEVFNIDLVFQYFPPFAHEKEDILNNPRILALKTKSLERRYYLSYPEIRTLKEFGEKMRELRELGTFD